MPPPPSGHSSQAAQAYYNWLYQNYLGAIPGDRTLLNLTNPGWIALYFVVIAVFFFLYTRYMNRVHRKEGELYGVVSFAGTVLERIGPVGVFTWAVSIGIFLWAAYYWITQILHGQVY